jgi:HD-GYP domain-containing protein (c-di-GMP phosphodiesterase class II)
MLQPYRTLEMLFRLPLSILGAAHGCMVVSAGDSTSAKVIAVHGRGEELGAILLHGDIPYLLELPVEPDLIQGPDLGILVEHGVKAVVRISALHSGASQGCGYYFFDHVLEIHPYQMTVLTTLGDRFAQEVASAHLLTEMSDRYLLTLRSLINALDSLTPYSVGHSDRLARYARLIGNEKGLPPDQVEAIALAAYLHDVGMIALDVGLLSNGDRWSPEQYEHMKQHAILGGQMISTVQAEVPITPSVQHHHERWDGYGYPHRLRGEEIPLGARIIAVCDVFDAKTTSRPGRQALPFARALQDLQAMAGTQLDPDLVAAFVRGIKRLGDHVATDQPVERCWVVRQVPADVCGDCRNRVPKTAHACWEDPANLCSRHGDVCATCMVYTEVLTRATGGEVL